MPAGHTMLRDESDAQSVDSHPEFPPSSDGVNESAPRAAPARVMEGLTIVGEFCPGEDL